MSKQNKSESTGKPPGTPNDGSETKLVHSLVRREPLSNLYKPPLRVRKGDHVKGDNKITRKKQPKARKVGKYIIKPGYWYAHVPLVIIKEESTKP
jgi:hypothetical protein